MKTLDQWFAEYGESHQNRTNQIIHKVCVPLIFFSVVGFLLLIPYSLGPIRVGELVIALALGWYLTLGPKAFVLMLVQLVVCYAAFYAIGQMTYQLIPLLVIFVLAWVGQFIGHKIEGKKPSFFKDLQFLLVGPLWVLKGLLK
ncbi:MAG TPA: Mpo1-like protein [Bdellovibrio sp.]